MLLAATTHIRYLDLTYQQLQEKLQVAETERTHVQKVSDALMHNAAERNDTAVTVDGIAAPDATADAADATTAAADAAAVAAGAAATVTNAAAAVVTSATVATVATATAAFDAIVDSTVDANVIMDPAPATVSPAAASIGPACVSSSVASVTAPDVVTFDASVAVVAPRPVTPVVYGLLTGYESLFLTSDSLSFDAVMLPYYY